jgi:hypothetical protein
MSKNKKKETSLQDKSEKFNNLLFNLKPLSKKPIELRFTAEKISLGGKEVSHYYRSKYNFCH